MPYEVAIHKAWSDLIELKPQGNFSIKFLADEYSIDLENKKLVSLACNVPAKDFLTILILHYFIKKLKGLPGLTGEWLSFKELSGIEGYYPAFKKRSIEPVIRKYGNNPSGLLEVLDRFPGKRVDQADIGIVLEAFTGVPVMIELWRADEEFGPEANILFDKSIAGIFCTEDIVVLSGLVAMSI